MYMYVDGCGIFFFSRTLLIAQFAFWRFTDNRISDNIIISVVDKINYELLFISVFCET